MSEQIGDGFPEGSGIFETIKTVGNRPIALGRHMRRALESAQALGITMPDEESIRRAILDSISSHPQEVGRLRLCFSVGKVDISHEPYSERIDPAPGTHSIYYNSKVDSIEITHTAHSREGFAMGALLVAEWLPSQTGVKRRV